MSMARDTCFGARSGTTLQGNKAGLYGPAVQNARYVAVPGLMGQIGWVRTFQRNAFKKEP
jgi:hypothetical protein